MKVSDPASDLSNIPAYKVNNTVIRVTWWGKKSLSKKMIIYMYHEQNLTKFYTIDSFSYF